jgi:probable HAF family extracellular repeat protein
MKRNRILVLILCACFASVAWAQQQAVMPRMGGRAGLRHRILNLTPKSTGMASDRSISTQAVPAPSVKVYDLGTYPEGTWAEMRDINDFGVAVGYGDTPSGYDPDLGRGYTRPIGVPLFGPHAMQWFDLGTFGGESYENSWCCANTAASEISDTGLIVGLAPVTNDPITHAFAWTPKSGKMDIGTLEDLGYSHSNALGVNKLGTLIVGWSGAEHQPWLDNSLPVVWTPKHVWESNGWTTTWKIQKLDTAGFEQFPHWFAATVNDSGHIIGSAFDDLGNQIAVLWKPLPGGKGWKIIQLDGSPDYPNAQPNDINERGEIVGIVYTADGSTALPALWKPAHQSKTWNLIVLPTLSGLPEGWNDANGINDRGDIVGDSNDADGNWLAARWRTKHTNFIQVLGFPGDWSTANKVNNYGIATGGYGIGDNPERAVAVQFR